MSRPLCFVLMPSGKAPAARGSAVDFDAVYTRLMVPAIQAAGLDPLRSDEAQASGPVDQSVFERLVLSEFAIADLSLATAQMYYALGLRHALRPQATTLLCAAGSSPLPFDVGGGQALRYPIGADGTPLDVDVIRDAFIARLQEARREGQTPDSPIVQLVEDFPDIQRLKTDVFRDQVRYSDSVKSRLAQARALGKSDGPAALRAVEAEMSNLEEADAGMVVDLLLSYRAMGAWEDMIRLVERMSRPLAATVLVQEQLGFALNRLGRSAQAEEVLLAVIEKRGPSSETCGLLGRVYKDRYQAAQVAGDVRGAAIELDKAIAAYLRGFNADIRDAFPGINAVTLMELRKVPDPRRFEILPVVTYAVKSRVDGGQPDYWDFATLLELAVLRKDPEDAQAALERALAAVRESWEPRSTLNNLGMIREARAARGEILDWYPEMEAALEARARNVEGGLNR